MLNTWALLFYIIIKIYNVKIMKFVLYCESDLDNINEIVKEVESTHKLTVKNVYVSIEDMNEHIDSSKISSEENKTFKYTDNPRRKPHISYPKNNGWEEYDKISNMPTL